MFIGDTISNDDILGLYYGVSTSLVNAPDDGDLTNFDVDGSFTYVHTKKGYDIMFDSGYGGEHWLATFAIYNFMR